jgi:hypothetical protein
LLTGKDLTAFVKRSVEMIWWPLGFLKPRRSLITFKVYKTSKVFLRTLIFFKINDLAKPQSNGFLCDLPACGR